ncbi:MAG: GtrA family protein [Eubacteriales bacterium]|nr:GtrA family protein [Eubacteriales bacterium]
MKFLQKIKDKLLNKEVLLYLLFGVLTTVVNYIVFAFFRKVIILPLLVANTLAWIFAVLFAFFSNRKYVFESNSKQIGKELLQFVMARILSFILFDQLSLLLLVNVLHINEFVAKLISNIFVVVFNYFASKWFIFKK